MSTYPTREEVVQILFGDDRYWNDLTTMDERNAWIQADEKADAIFALFPPMQPGRWWSVRDPNGKVWCETSNEREALESMRPGDTLGRWWTPEPSQEWRPEHPLGQDIP